MGWYFFNCITPHCFDVSIIKQTSWIKLLTVCPTLPAQYCKQAKQLKIQQTGCAGHLMKTWNKKNKTQKKQSALIYNVESHTNKVKPDYVSNFHFVLLDQSESGQKAQSGQSGGPLPGPARPGTSCLWANQHPAKVPDDPQPQDGLHGGTRAVLVFQGVKLNDDRSRLAVCCVCSSQYLQFSLSFFFNLFFFLRCYHVGFV